MSEPTPYPEPDLTTMGLTAREALEQRLDDYLEGLLDVAETRAVERLLADPEVAAVLAEAIAFRELLSAFPQDPIPQGLEARIFDALGVEDARRVSSRPRTPTAAPSAGSGAQLALGGASRALRENRRTHGGREVLAGLKMAMTPWGLRTRGDGEEAAKPPKRPLWKRALGLGRQR